jgi:hypothetical protein
LKEYAIEFVPCPTATHFLLSYITEYPAVENIATPLPIQVIPLLLYAIEFVFPVHTAI